MRIGAVYGRHPGADIYVIGTGPSMRCFPIDWLKDKICIGLNQAWKHIETTYALTVHPELLDEYERSGGSTTQWFVKKKPPRAHLQLSDPRYYVFGTSYKVEAVRERPDDTLYLGEGAQTTAMDLAARMGAASVILVGCDAACLGGDYHAHDQHVRWVGRDPNAQYKMYRDSAAGVREALRGLGVRVMSLTPFIGAGAAAEDYARLRGALGLAPLPEPTDISPPDWKPPKR